MNSTPGGVAVPGHASPPEIPDFELLRAIGQGGFGRVWLARNRATGQLRAIKVIPRSAVGATDPAGREIVALTLLEVNLRRQHPRLLAVHHVGQTREHLFYVMDLADDVTGRAVEDPSSYAAGLVVYEMITGWPPDRFPQLGRRADDIAGNATLAALMRLALRACQTDPAERFADGREMLAALQRRSPAAYSFPLRRWIIVAAAVCAVGAASLLGAVRWLSAAPKRVNFVTYPFDARILLDGKPLLGPDGVPLATPCTVENLGAGKHHVVFRLPQRPDADAGAIDFDTTRQVEVRWPSDPREDDPKDRLDRL